jgi:hypothetical protein
MEKSRVRDKHPGSATLLSTEDVFIPRLSKGGELKRSRTILRLEPLEGEQAASYSLRLATSHYAFSLKRSVTNRSIQSFYELAAILKVGGFLNP